MREYGASFRNLTRTVLVLYIRCTAAVMLSQSNRRELTYGTRTVVQQFDIRQRGSRTRTAKVLCCVRLISIQQQWNYSTVLFSYARPTEHAD